MVRRLSVAERKVSMTENDSVLGERIGGMFSSVPAPELIVASLGIVADMPLEHYCLGGAALETCREVMNSDLVGSKVEGDGTYLSLRPSSVCEAVGVALLLDEASHNSRAHTKTLLNLRDQLIRALLAPVERYVERHRRGWDRRQEGSAGSRTRRAFCYDVSILTTQRKGPRPTPREAYALLCVLAFADGAHIREAIATLGGLAGRDALEAQTRYEAHSRRFSGCQTASAAVAYNSVVYADRDEPREIDDLIELCAGATEQPELIAGDTAIAFLHLYLEPIALMGRFGRGCASRDLIESSHSPTLTKRILAA